MDLKHIRQEEDKGSKKTKFSKGKRRMAVLQTHSGAANILRFHCLDVNNLLSWTLLEKQTKNQTDATVPRLSQTLISLFSS